MMLSMTGYGKGSANDGKIFVDVEVKSVNSRYLDISLRLSSPLLDRETELREWIRNKIKRGKLSIVIGIKRNGIEEGISDIDEEKLKSYLSFIKKIKKVSKIDEKVKLEHLLYNKEIFLSKSEVFSETEFNLIKEALDNALSNLIKMEKNEGKELTKDLKKRIKIIEEKLDNIEKDRDAGIQEYFQKHFVNISIDIEGDVEMVNFKGINTKQKDFAFKENRVRATPVIAFFDLNGKRIHRHIGKTNGVQEFLWMGEYIVEGAYKEMPFIRYKRKKRQKK